MADVDEKGGIYPLSIEGVFSGNAGARKREDGTILIGFAPNLNSRPVNGAKDASFNGTDYSVTQLERSLLTVGFYTAVLVPVPVKTKAQQNG